MVGEEYLVLMMVGGALAYLVRRGWRSWFGSGSGCSSCGTCASSKERPADTATALIPSGQIRLRRARGPESPNGSYWGTWIYETLDL